ncbi:hypothetical protein BRADI_1g07290v3 [Brachypodium distachyon]|uniref:AP2/ERF domain-containing protein n=1 Tax=Brachypodium distachyon TaxID=15368 RepID=A0A2K2DIG3_BRADI|nr:hypothetical protein BRADI_1g07290v3 [Brachypodium distachyon]
MTNSGSAGVVRSMSGNGIVDGGSWLGFSMSPHAAAPMAAGSAIDIGGQHVQHQGGFYYPPATVTSSPASYYLGGAGNVAAAANGGYNYYSGVSSMPLKSDGSLCIMEALHRNEQEHQAGAMGSASASPKLENFLGAGPAMALSLDSSSYYYAGRGHALDRGAGAGTHQVQYAIIPGASAGHDVYYDAHAHAAMMDEQAAMAAAGWMARGEEGGYDHGGNGAEDGALVPVDIGNQVHPLALSISSGSQASCVTMQASAYAGEEFLAVGAAVASKKRGAGQNKQAVQHRKSIDTFGQRTSKFRGVTSRHRWTGRYEAHLWDNTCTKEGQTRKGRQVYLGGYDMEEKAARAYDLAALKYWGPATHINFPVEDYQEELEEMKKMTRQEFVAHLRRKSSGFSRGASIYRGVTRHHQHGRWQARIGRVSGNKDLYLGTFTTQEEAAEAYDVAAIKFRGLNAVTNFEITRYDVEKIMQSSTLLPGDEARRKSKNAESGGALVANDDAADWRTATPCEAFYALQDIVSVDDEARVSCAGRGRARVERVVAGDEPEQLT